MKKLSLYFQFSETGFCLVETRFSGADTEPPLRAVRGGGAGHSGMGVFPWSKGVKALCLLLLKQVLWNARTHTPQDLALDNELPMLIGEASSPAAALDGALSKESNWLCDMFGMTAGGKSFARRLFSRTNPERKLPGPVRIGINKACELEVRIFVNGSQVNDCIVVGQMAEELASEWRPLDSSSRLIPCRAEEVAPERAAA